MPHHWLSTKITNDLQCKELHIKSRNSLALGSKFLKETQLLEKA